MTAEEKLSMIESLLPDDFSESKNWKNGDVVERIVWLKSMLESKTEECEMWLEQILMHNDSLQIMTGK